MAFKTLEEFLGDCLELPTRCSDGELRTFRIPSPPAEDGLKIENIMTAGLRAAEGGAPLDGEALDDAEELDLYRMALGSAYDDVLKHLAWPRFRHVAMTSVMWITAGHDVAEQYWNSDGDPKVAQAAQNRAARRASSAAASTTKRPASTSGTSTRTGTGRARKAART
jgi:hypothetical protein